MENKSTPSRFFKLSGSITGLILLLAILVAANIIVGQFTIRKDMTEEKLYTLSDGTRQTLKKLDRNVDLMFFFNSSAPEVPGPLKQFARQVEMWDKKPALLFVMQYDRFLASLKFERFKQYPFVIDQRDTLALT